jgi:predicted phage tail protein
MTTRLKRREVVGVALLLAVVLYGLLAIERRKLDCEALFEGSSAKVGYFVRIRVVGGDYDMIAFTTKTSLQQCGLAAGVYEVTVRTVWRWNCKTSAASTPKRVRVVGVTEEPYESPYPNPFNATLSIPYRVPEGAAGERVQVVIFDATGAVVDVLNEGLKASGEHVARWNAAGRASGVYFVQLKVGDRIRLSKVVLLK